jgi:hypothetical protein
LAFWLLMAHRADWRAVSSCNSCCNLLAPTPHRQGHEAAAPLASLAWPSLGACVLFPLFDLQSDARQHELVRRVLPPQTGVNFPELGGATAWPRRRGPTHLKLGPVLQNICFGNQVDSLAQGAATENAIRAAVPSRAAFFPSPFAGNRGRLGEGTYTKSWHR